MAIGDFLHFGILSSTKKGTKYAYQPNFADLGLSSASIKKPSPVGRELHSM